MIGEGSYTVSAATTLQETVLTYLRVTQSLLIWNQ